MQILRLGPAKGLESTPIPWAPASILPSEEWGLCTFLAVLNSSHRPSDTLELARNLGSFGLEKAYRTGEFEQLEYNNVLIDFF